MCGCSDHGALTLRRPGALESQKIRDKVPVAPKPQASHLQLGKGKKGGRRVQRRMAWLLYAAGHQSLNGKGQASSRTPWPEAGGQPDHPW